jgi:hypothetical protein
MRRRLIFLALIALLTPCGLQAQRTEVEADEAELLAEAWIDRLNALDEWSLSMDGQAQGFDEVVDRMMEPFGPDVVSYLPPHDEDQIGPVILRGSGQLRKWVEKIASTHVRLDYIRNRRTGGAYQGAYLVYSTPLPWGGLGISFQITAAYSLREDRRRFMAPGTVFLEFDEDRKIQRIRLYLTEISEVDPT